MYLHLGADVIVKTSDIIGVFDLEQSSLKKDTRIFLEKAQNQNQIINVSDDLPKSFCVCEDKKKEIIVYISQISPTTLKKRLGYLKD